MKIKQEEAEKSDSHSAIPIVTKTDSPTPNNKANTEVSNVAIDIPPNIGSATPEGRSPPHASFSTSQLNPSPSISPKSTKKETEKAFKRRQTMVTKPLDNFISTANRGIQKAATLRGIKKTHGRRKSELSEKDFLPSLLSTTPANHELGLVSQGIIFGKQFGKKNWKIFHIRLTNTHLQFCKIQTKKKEIKKIEQSSSAQVSKVNWLHPDLSYEIGFSTAKVIGKKDGKWCLEILAITARMLVGWENEQAMLSWHKEILECQNEKMLSRLSMSPSEKPIANSVSPKEVVEVIKQLQKVEGNSVCADCKVKNPSWIVLNHGNSFFFFAFQKH